VIQGSHMDAVTALKTISEVPSDDASYAAWLDPSDALAFLRQNCEDTEFVIYAANASSFIYAVPVPLNLLAPPDYDDIADWNCNPTSCWGIEIRMSEPREFWINPPLDHSGSRTLGAGEQILFLRHFDGLHGKKSYVEILQKLTQVLGIHFVGERKAYCRLDQCGDLEDIIRIVEEPGRGNDFGSLVVVMRREALDEYLVLTQAAIIRLFDFTRYRSGFNGWDNRNFSGHERDGDLYYRKHVEPAHASFARGFQIVHPIMTKTEVARIHDFSTADVGRQYASFIAFDFKNKIVCEISTEPGATANYFTQSALPFETSPAFFRPEVLLRYKSDTEKYTLLGRSISCRGGWSLQTFDINDVGQVHTYIVYLRHLPYSEQLHWKAHNEAPKAGISKRAVETDFKGQWYSEYDALSSLQEILQQWYSKDVQWWTLRNESLIDLVHYPVTTSVDEWSDELLRLDQLVNEGFRSKWLRQRAELLSRTPPSNFGSLKLIGECLLGMQFEEVDVSALTEALRELHHLRSKMRGHATGQEAIAIRKKLLDEHGSLKNHFVSLCQRCDESIRAISKAFDEHPL